MCNRGLLAGKFQRYRVGMPAPASAFLLEASDHPSHGHRCPTRVSKIVRRMSTSYA